MKVCAAVLTYNSITRHGTLIYKVLDSILSVRSIDRVVVLDNGSSDETTYKLSERYTNCIDIFKLSRNYGYAGAYSLFCKLVKNKYRYVILLNDDYIVNPEGIEDMLRAIKRSENSSIAVVQGINLIYGTKERVLDAGAFIDICGNIVRRYHYLKLSECVLKPSYISLVNGACMIVDLKKVFRLRGELFCVSYFMYAEDDELSMYLWSHGLKVVSLPTVAGYHAQGRLNCISCYYLYRNRTLNICRYYTNKLRSAKLLTITRYLVKSIFTPFPLNKYSIKGLFDSLIKLRRKLMFTRGPYYPLILVPRGVKMCIKSLVASRFFADDYINRISKLIVDEHMLKQSADPYIVCV